MRAACLRFVVACSVTLVVLAVAACHSDSSRPPASSSGQSPAPYAAPEPAGPSPDVAAQISRGQQLFAQSCARCHGPGGGGSANAPAVIGPGTLPAYPPAGRRVRTGTFHTAKDVGMFIKDNMPPGSHTPPDQTGAILAYLLQAHGITPTETMTPTAAARVVLNP